MPDRRTRLLTALAVLLAMLVAATPVAAEDTDGPIVGTPPEDALTGWVENWMDPDFWSGWVREMLIEGHFNLPYPFDPVKPEAYLPNVPVANGDYVSALPVAHRDLSDITY